MTTDPTRLPTQAELAARIEAVSQMFLCLAAELEITGLIEGKRMSRGCRDRAESLRNEGWHPTLAWYMDQMTDALDRMREFRQTRAAGQESPTRLSPCIESLEKRIRLVEVRTEYQLAVGPPGTPEQMDRARRKTEDDGGQ